MPKSRRQAREAALRALYGMEIARARLDDAIEEMSANTEMSADLRQFARELLEGVYSNREFIDGLLSSLVQEYDFDRIAAVDRNLLRIASYEIYFCPETPPAVSINEAIEIAKKYSTAESGRFVNGVLGKVLAGSPKAAWDPSAHRGEIEDVPAPEPYPEVETIDENAPEVQTGTRYGKWQVRSGGEN